MSKILGLQITKYCLSNFAAFLQVVMVGDDIVSDVGGAQACGMRGVQVKTGKWRYVPKCSVFHIQTGGMS